MIEERVLIGSALGDGCKTPVVEQARQFARAARSPSHCGHWRRLRLVATFRPILGPETAADANSPITVWVFPTSRASSITHLSTSPADRSSRLPRPDGCRRTPYGCMGVGTVTQTDNASVQG